jgi:hypothetical protein
MYSREVSLKPPFLALVRGVRTARVMTMSSGFFWVLGNHGRLADFCFVALVVRKAGGCREGAYIWETALPGERCLRIEPNRSAAIFAVFGGGIASS